MRQFRKRENKSAALWTAQTRSHTKLRSRRVLGVKGQGRFSPSPVRERACSLDAGPCKLFGVSFLNNEERDIEFCTLLFGHSL
ncbi:hypothetical protein SBDP1_260006 [Syntrophobacter sp. SbD1]|nr:hypothetical protein SBDP1_260006 [Syntrophobacter sp. SbD1]